MKLLVKLKQAKVDKEKKWMYNLVAWVLANPEADYHQIQRRINASHYNNKGYFKRYLEDNEEARIKNNERASLRIKTTQVKEKQRVLQQNYREIWKLYQQGKLSAESTKEIEEKVKRR